VKYFFDAGAILLKRTWCILNGIVIPWHQSVLIALRDVDSLAIFLYYFDLFYNGKWRRISLWLYYYKLCNRLFL